MTLAIKCVTKYSQGKAVLSVYIAAKDILVALLIAKKMEHISYKSGRVVQVTKHLKGDWFITLY